MKSFQFFILLLIPFIVMSEESCKRPDKLLEFEEACKTDPEVTGNTGTFLEQLQENIAAAMEQTKRLINIAKQKLGIKVNEEETDQQQMKKCEYYQCIFKKMDSLGTNNFPNMTSVEAWVNDNVADNMKDQALVKTYSCFNAMASNIDRGSSTAMEDNTPMSSTCELSANLMMCLHNDMMCSVFQYP